MMLAHGWRFWGGGLVSAAMIFGGGMAASANAAPAVLWACHGRDGRALGDTGLRSNVAGDGSVAPYGAGCALSVAPGATTDGMRATVTRPDPAGGASASWSVAVPGGLPVAPGPGPRRRVVGELVGGRPGRPRAALGDAHAEDPRARRRVLRPRFGPL